MIKPFVTAVADYHDFNNVVRHFKDAGIKLKYVEVGCGITPYWHGPYYGYHAVFYPENTDTNDPVVKQLIDEWQAIIG